MNRDISTWGNLLNHEKYNLIIANAKIVVNDGVFTPDPTLSYSASIIINNLPQLKGKRVADIGTGTGVIAVISAMQGAEEVVATDISDEAVKNALINVNENNVGDKVIVLKTNLLNDVQGKFDIICANLPILDELWESQGVKVESTIELFLRQAKGVLNPGGEIYLPWGSFAKGKDALEVLFIKYGYNFRVIKEEKLGYTWFLYILSR
jgi:release factor glutamine methyltransferase